MTLDARIYVRTQGVKFRTATIVLRRSGGVFSRHAGVRVDREGASGRIDASAGFCEARPDLWKSRKR